MVSITANWRKKSQENKKFFLYISTGARLSPVGPAVGTTDTQETISGLRPDTRYHVFLTTTPHHSPYYYLGAVRTLGKPWSPGVVAFLKVTGNGLSAAWVSTSTAKAPFYVSLATASGTNSAAASSTTFNTSATFLGLSPGTTYFVQVATAAGGPYLWWSSTRTLSMLPPATAPPGLSGTALGVSSISWSWSLINGAAAYNLYISTSNPISVSGTAFIQTGLSPNTPYAARVSALNAGGEGPASDVVSARTLSPEEVETAATTLSDPKVYPNPFRPALGETIITFANLPAFTLLKIYDILGERVRELNAGATGTATWDGRNMNGNACASGVYFVLAGSGSSRATLKVAIQR